MIEFSAKGDFRKTLSMLERLKGVVHLSDLDRYGRMGVDALSSATPQDTGLLSESWYYKIERRTDSATITWCNSDIEGGANVALLVQYGHGTRGGTYVQGIDYINPALRPVFDKICKEIHKEVTIG